jgi:hypothetical protein
MLLGEKNAKMLRIQDDHTITFQDRRIGPGIHRYLAQVQTEYGEMVNLQPGAAFAIYATPFDPSAVFVATEDNSFIGIARRLQAVCKTDTDAIHRQIGKSMHFEQQLLEPVKARHQEEARAMKNMRERNASVLAGEPVTAEELFRAELVEKSAPDCGDIEAVTAHSRNNSDDEFSNDEITKLFTN